MTPDRRKQDTVLLRHRPEKLGTGTRHCPYLCPIDQDTQSKASMEELPTVLAEVSASMSKALVGQDLCRRIVKFCDEAMQAHGWFSVAISGGSLPDFLSNLSQAFQEKEIDPKFDRWLIFLADERGVPETHEDSNMRSIRQAFLSKVDIPPDQVYGIDETALSQSIDAAAVNYQTRLLSGLAKTGGSLDLALLGFGPDGHTCSLFPDDTRMLQSTEYVAAISDSPKPPPCRITLTLKVLNEYTRNIIVCGTGDSKSPILREILQDVYQDDSTGKTMAHIHPKYPCGMVRPQSHLAYICDDDAVKDVLPRSKQ